MSTEIYRDIPDYPDYQITSWGRVYNKRTRKYIAFDENEKGYLRVGLWRNGKKKNFKVHRLVAGEFIPNPLDKPQVNHKDGNKKNNSISNLEWVTNQENCDHANMLRSMK